MNNEFLANLFSGPDSYREICALISGTALLIILAFLYGPLLETHAFTSLALHLGYTIQLFAFFSFAYLAGNALRILGWFWMLLVRTPIPLKLTISPTKIKEWHTEWRRFFDYKKRRLISEADQNLVSLNITDVIHKNPGLRTSMQTLRNIQILTNTAIGAFIVCLVVLCLQNSIIQFSFLRFWMLFAGIIALTLYNIDTRKDISNFRLQAGRLFVGKNAE